MIPADLADAIQSDPRWRWADDPTSAISYAVTTGVNARDGELTLDGTVGTNNPLSAQLWTYTACLLVSAAFRQRGASLNELVRQYGDPILRPDLASADIKQDARFRDRWM